MYRCDACIEWCMSLHMRSYPDEIKQAARGLYLKRHTVKEIAEALNVPRRTLYFWIEQGGWDDMLGHEGPEQALHRRLALLAEREKTPQDLKEIDTLVGALERMQTLRLRTPQAGKEAREMHNGEAAPTKGRSTPRGKPKIKNDVSHLTLLDFQEKFHSRYYDYQREWYRRKAERNRMTLKSRQIGATWYFAQEALEDAVLTGDNQIFLSATKAQAQVFKNYITQLAGEAFDITLTGNPLILHTARGAAELHFLSNNSKSAQSYHGHVYIDEFFWITKFNELFKVATGMAAHKKWRRTLFSTPSAITHEAYALWSGENFQKRFAKRKPWPLAADISKGCLCPDSWFRQIINLQDAIKGGCDLFDVEQLKLEYSVEAFRQLFGCEFIDDLLSAFSLALLEKCMIDPSEWEDVHLQDAQPVGQRPVWGGYDPARTGDDASFSILLPPLKAGGEIRRIEKFRWQGKSYLWQAGQIKELCQRYNFAFMGIDCTGPGIGVYEQVKVFCPVVQPINYSVNVKTMLCLKAMEVMEQGRFFFDAGDIELAHAFMTIKKGTTDSGQISYAASRTASTGHADEAWSVMHALAAEPLARGDGLGRCELSFG